jgi:hypothetical protein
MEGAGQKCHLTSPFIEAASGIEPLLRVLQTVNSVYLDTHQAL